MTSSPEDANFTVTPASGRPLRPAAAPRSVTGIEAVADVHAVEAAKHPAVVEQGGEHSAAVEQAGLFDEGGAAQGTHDTVAAHADIAEEVADESPFGVREISPVATPYAPCFIASATSDVIFFNSSAVGAR